MKPHLLVVIITATALLTACSGGGGNDVAGPEYTVVVHMAGNGTGRVVSIPAAIDCPGVCGPLDWSNGMTVHMTATADNGSSFASWTGDCTGSDPNDCVFVVNGHMDVTANFTSP